MDFDIDIDKITDPTKRQLYKEAFVKLENHEAEVMAEVGIYISQEGKINYLNKLRNSRMQDIARMLAPNNIDGEFRHGWFTIRTGLPKDEDYTRPLCILICELTIEWCRKKIEQMNAGPDQKPGSVGGHNNSETALIFYFGMLALGFTPGRDDSVANFARFLHALMRKPVTRVANSDFYDKLKLGPLVTKDSKLRLKYLQNVRTAFEQCGFKEPLSAIDKEIVETKLEVEESKIPKKRMK